MADSPMASPKTAFKRLHVIVNPAAGQDRPFLQTMNAVFKDAGVDWDLFITKEAGDAKRLAQEAVKSGADVVAAYGGDGTVGEVASGLVGSDVPLAIIPGGTANVMSIELGIPSDIAGAVKLICGDGVQRPVDMGETDDMLFMLRATVGYGADMTKMTGREEKNRLGNLAYILSAMKLVPNMQSVPYKLTLDGEVIELPGTICYVANSGSLGLPGLTLNAKVNISDGLIDVVLVQAEHIGAIMQVAASAAGLSELVNHWQVREVTIESEPAQTVEVDGEVVEPTPFTARVLPHAVQVLVPANTNGNTTQTEQPA